MSFNQGSSNDGMNQDAQINIASIIDCFTVLITYVLAAASFVSLGAIEAGIAGAPVDPAAAQMAPSTAPQMNVFLHLNLAENAKIEMKSEVGGQKADQLVDDEAILRDVTAFKSQHAELKSITLSAVDSVPYERMVKLVAGLKAQQLPVIFSGNPE